MKKLNELIDTKLDIVITNLNDDSRCIKPGGLFFAIKGLTNDGNIFNESAIKNGAVCIVTEEDVTLDVPVIKVSNAQEAYSEALNKFYDNVRDKLKYIGITGTDGKTTTAEIIFQLISNYEKCGYIGTNGVKSENFYLENDHTTPFPADLYYDLNELNKIGCKYLAMECTSERLYTHRIDEFKQDVAIYTNLSRDHLDTHKTMENYAKAKAMLFSNLKPDGLGIINYNDEYKNYMIDATSSKYVTYSIDNDKADLYASNIKLSFEHLEFDINGLYNKHIKTNLSGLFNVNNIMTAILALTHLGFDIDSVVQNVEKLKPIESRQIFLKTDFGFNIMVDYAHTKNGVENLLEFVKPLAKGRVLALTGGSGSRDPRRMIDVANYLVENVDHSYFTIEDPRYDEVKPILEKMISEVKKYNNYEVIENRDEAIKKCIMDAREGDLVLILGKGLESYHIVKGELIPRPNDYESALIALKEREKITQKN